MCPIGGKMKKKIVVMLLLGVISLGLLTGCDSKKEAEKDLQETINKYGSVEKETVETLVAKFNTEVMDNSNGKLNPASEDYLTVDNNSYWYGLVEGVYLVVNPVEFSDDKTKEIVDNMMIYVDKGGEYESDAVTYTKHLIKANYDNFTEEEINALLDESKEKSTKKEKANNGKGISVGYTENTENYQYQVTRLYKNN